VATAKQLHDRAVLHRVWLGRYSNGMLRRVLTQLQAVEQDVLGRVEANRGTSQAALQTLLADVRGMQVAAQAGVAGLLESDLAGLGGSEVLFQQQLMIGGAAEVGVTLTEPALSVVNVVAAAKARPFQGRLLRDWIGGFDESSQRRVREAITLGFTENESIDAIVRRLRGTQRAGYADGVLAINRRGAEALVRTAVTHMANTAAQLTYDAAGPLVVGVEWVSTLDSRTTKLCASRDGRVYPVDSGPRPPAHINCRSTTIPRLRGMAAFQRTTYEAWLRDQPAHVQNEVLGVKGGQLFRTGRLALKGFVDSAGNELTLEQLRRRDASLFAQAA
jgi:SPP1 gp7 family putative phage head morphogenesis protein